MEICERCDRRRDGWQVNEWHLFIGELHRRPHLCHDCTVTVMSAVLAALRKPPPDVPETETWNRA